ncbi:MAG: hypothetical protein Q8P67_14020 [archaeon]|nr:hypothetical protein [archaeon]
MFSVVACHGMSQDASFWASRGYPRSQPFVNPFEDVFVSEDGLRSVHFNLPALSVERVWKLLSAPPSEDKKAQNPIPASYEKKKNHLFFYVFLLSSYLLFVLFRLERYYDFIPFQIGSIKTQPLKWSSPCFSDLSFALTFNDTTALVSIQAAGKTNAVCSELYSFCDRESCHFKPLDVPGHHTVQFELAQYEYTDITRNGLGTYLWPLGIEGTTESLRKTLSLFSGEDMVQNNIDFFAQKELWAVNPRPYNFLNLSVDNFHSGDMLTVLRLDGVDPLIGILSSTNFFLSLKFFIRILISSFCCFIFFVSF